MRVSVIVPTYNCAQYVGEALRSIEAQTLRPFEVLVLDDGSTDGTAEVLKGFNDARRMRLKHGGAAHARNVGVSEARGDFLAFLDADDLWMPDKLETQMQAFRHRLELDMVFGHVQEFHSPEIAPADRRGCLRENAPGIIPGAMLVKAESFRRVGQFSTSFRVGEFVDWYTRAREHGLQGHMLESIVLRRRIHSSNLGIRERGSLSDYATILKTSLDRRRAAADSLK